MHNLLTDPIIRLTTRDLVEKRSSLPEVYELLMQDQVESFRALRHYQVHSWHAFLCQLGTMALNKAGITGIPEDSGAWTGLLRNMTKEYPHDQPWQLVVPNVMAPAFMQPPTKDENNFVQYKKVLLTPDKMDMTVTSKNHDIKATIATQASPDDWMFAIISEQTMNGVIGLGLRAISRMNGGRSNRPALSLAPLHGGPGARLRRDIEALKEALPNISRNHPEYPEQGGIALVWLEPWDGQKDEILSKKHLDPLYIEVCRRLRLTRGTDGAMVALRATSKDQRITFVSGLTGDPWAPVDRRKDKIRSITIPSPPLNLESTIDLLVHEDIDHPHLLTPTQAEAEGTQPMRIIGRVFCRGQGKTSGYHERSITARPTLIRALRDRRSHEYTAFKDTLEARTMVAKKVHTTLQNAAQTFMTGGSRRSASQEHKLISYKIGDRLYQEIHNTFFTDLQDELEAQDESERIQARLEWVGQLTDQARTILQEELLSMGCPSARRNRSTFAANRYFETMLRTDTTIAPLMEQIQDQQKKRAEQRTQRTAEEADGTGEDQTEEIPRDEHDDRIVRTAQRIAQLARSTPKDLNELRRMDPQEPHGPVFTKLITQEQIMPRGEDEAKWGLIIHGMAVMTPVGSSKKPYGPHAGRQPVGRTLYLGGKDRRTSAFYSEQDMNHLLMEKGQASRTRLQRVFKVLGWNDAKIDWREMANLILADGTDEENAQEARRRIAQDYFNAQRRNRQY